MHSREGGALSPISHPPFFCAAQVRPQGIQWADTDIGLEAAVAAGLSDLTAFPSACLGFCSASLAYSAFLRASDACLAATDTRTLSVGAQIGGYRTSITLAFVLSSTIAVGDRFNLTLPGFYGVESGPIALSSGSSSFTAR
jgi:hypothetical protein